MKSLPFSEVVTDVTAKFTKIKASDYHGQGQYKIIDQGKGPVAGYTDDASLVNGHLLPVVVFGDHTRALKYVDEPIALGADGAKALWVNPDLANARYVYYYLRSIQIKEAGYSRHFKFLKAIEIPIPFKDDAPDFDDQIRIAHLLGKVEGLIAQRKQHLQQLDDLLKSIFLDMFGDQLASGPKTTLGTYITTLSDYHANGSYETLKEHVQLSTEPGYALMVRTTDLENKNFSEGCNYITKEAYEFLEKSKVYGGEIIVNKIGSAGKVYLMPSLGRPVSLGMNAFLLRFNEGLNNIFAYHFLISDVGTQRIQKLVKGAVTKTITKDAIRSIAIPVIPPDYQGKFADAAAKVESIKTSYQQSLSELEALYCALSQQAFKGELDLSRVPMPGMNPEEEQTVAAEPLQTPAEQSLAIHLPDIGNLPAALESAEARKNLLAQWLEAYRGQLDSTPFSVQHFMAAAQTRLTELHPDNDFELGANDYEHIKAWVFNALAAGTLTQAFDDAGNRIELKSVQT